MVHPDGYRQRYRHSRAHCMYLYLIIVQTYIVYMYLAGLLKILLLPCNRMLKNVNFNKRLDAATKDFEICKFQFHIVLLDLNGFESFGIVFLQEIK